MGIRRIFTTQHSFRWTIFRLKAANRIERESECLQGSDQAAAANELNSSLTDTLHKAGKHMEDTIGTIHTQTR